MPPVPIPPAYAKMLRQPLSAMTKDELTEVAQFLMALSERTPPTGAGAEERKDG